MDIDRLPVSMKGVDLDIWLSTKTGAPSFFASVRDNACLNCHVLEDGSVLVDVAGHRLPPGRLRANIAVLSNAEGHHHHHGPATSVTPNVPVELTESSCTHNTSSCDPDCGAPIIVTVQFPLHRPSFTHHITKAEMDQAIQSAINSSGHVSEDQVKDAITQALGEFDCCATDEDISDITSLFDFPGKNIPEIMPLSDKHSSNSKLRIRL